MRLSRQQGSSRSRAKASQRWHAVALVLALLLPGTLPAAAQAAPPAGYSVLGIDVSSYQTVGEWLAVKASGVSFAYIRASEQAATPDASFAANYAEAKGEGLFVGAYHRAKPDASSGTAQADYFLDRAEFTNDGKTLPPALDMEWPRSGWTSPSGRPLDSCYNMTPAQLVAWARAFLAEVAARTGRPGTIYTSTSWWNLCTASDGTFGQYPLWVARYSTSPLPLPAGWTNFAFWQYSNTGKLPNGNPVDQDVFNGNGAALASLAQTTRISLTSWLDRRYQHVAYFSADGHAHELYFRLGGRVWAQNDLTASTGGPPALPGSALTSWLDARYQHVAYLSADGHVHELYLRLGGRAWAQNDLNVSTSAPPALPGSALTSWVDIKYQHLVYFSADGHLRELSFPLSGGRWTASDLTRATGAPAPLPGSALTSWITARSAHVSYLSADGHAHELYSPLTGGRWRQSDLTAATGAPPAASSSALTSWVDRGYQHVVYTSADGHAHELYFRLSGGTWRRRDLTTSAGTPPASPSSVLTSWVDHSYQHVVYASLDGHAHEFYFGLSGGLWRQTDVTQSATAPPASDGLR